MPSRSGDMANDEVPQLSFKFCSPSCPCTRTAVSSLCGACAGMGLLRLRRSNGGSGRHGKQRSTSDPTYEARIQVALQGVASGIYPSLTAADIAHNPRFSALFQSSGKTCARNPPLKHATHAQVPALNFDTMDLCLSFTTIDPPSFQPQAIGNHTQSYPHSTSWLQDDIYDQVYDA